MTHPMSNGNFLFLPTTLAVSVTYQKMSFEEFPSELCLKVARYTASDDDIKDDLFLSSLSLPAVASRHHHIGPLASVNSVFNSICRPILFSHISLISATGRKTALEDFARMVVVRPHVAELIK